MLLIFFLFITAASVPLVWSILHIIEYIKFKNKWTIPTISIFLSVFLINLYGFLNLFFSENKDEIVFWDFATCWSFGIAIIILGAIVRFILRSIGRVGPDKKIRRFNSGYR